MSGTLKDKLSSFDIPDLMKCIEETGYMFKSNNTRSESAVKNMRSFHNKVKSTLIKNISEYYNKSRQPLSLLDISVGRGGDIAKWDNAYITNVFGFDVSTESVSEANSRFNNYTPKKLLKNVVFKVGDATKPEIKKNINDYMSSVNIKKFDLVSCQFALHYFFKSEESLKHVLKLVSGYLKQGGYFFGTTINSKILMEYFNQVPGEEVINKELYMIHRFFSMKHRKKYSNKYIFTIKDSDDPSNYFESLEDKKSTEYLVSFEELTRVAEEFGLRPVFLNFFEKHQGNYTRSENNVMNFVDIYPTFENSVKMTQEEQEISFLNSVFVFKKE